MTNQALFGVDLSPLPRRGWGVLRLTEGQVMGFAFLLAGGFVKAQSVSGLDRVFQVRLTGKGREALRQLDKRAVV